MGTATTALRCDTVRAFGRAGRSLVLLGAIRSRTFRPILTMRLCQWTSESRHGLKLFLPVFALLHRAASSLAGLELPWRTEVGAGLAIHHGFGIVVAPRAHRARRDAAARRHARAARQAAAGWHTGNRLSDAGRSGLGRAARGDHWGYNHWPGQPDRRGGRGDRERATGLGRRRQSLAGRAQRLPARRRQSLRHAAGCRALAGLALVKRRECV